MIRMAPPTKLVLCEGNRHIVRFPIDWSGDLRVSAVYSFERLEARAHATGTVNRCRIVRGRRVLFAGTAGLVGEGARYDVLLDNVHVAEGQRVCASLSVCAL